MGAILQYEIRDARMLELEQAAYEDMHAVKRGGFRPS